MVSAHSHRIPRAPWYSGYCRLPSGFAYTAFTFFGGSFQDPSASLVDTLCSPNPMTQGHGLGSSAFARRYLRNRYYFLFLRLLRCFSSPGSPRIPMYSVYGDRIAPAGFPHSDISGSLPVCGSPKLFAAYHVFHRLSVPRHPPCALISFTYLVLLSAVRKFVGTGEECLHSDTVTIGFS